jgi:hypothetical protein
LEPPASSKPLCSDPGKFLQWWITATQGPDVVYHFQAFMNDPDAPRPDNPIHSTAGGKQHGFRGALVGGIHVYGWTTAAFVARHGEGWLDSGWTEVYFKKPTYDGDRMSVNMHGENFTATNRASEVCLEGKFGMGSAPWLSDISCTRFQEAGPAAKDPMVLTLDTAPRGRDLVPMGVEFTTLDHEKFVNDTLRDENPLFHGKNARCHPAWLAGRLIYLLHHSFEYGPAIHTASHIQHLAPAHVGQRFIITGYCYDAFERNGHHYIVNDGSIWSESGDELARLRHTAIFKLRTAGAAG